MVKAQLILLLANHIAANHIADVEVLREALAKARDGV